jgi:hypothetical protein
VRNANAPKEVRRASVGLSVRVGGTGQIESASKIAECDRKLAQYRAALDEGGNAAVALVGSYELLMMVIRNAQMPADGTLASGRDADPLQKQAAEVFADQLAADRIPSIRAIRAQLHIGQPRAQRMRACLEALTGPG